MSAMVVVISEAYIRSSQEVQQRNEGMPRLLLGEEAIVGAVRD